MVCIIHQTSRIYRFCIPVILGLILLGSANAHGGSILFVDDDAPLGGDGLSWETAYRFLQDALTNASGGGVSEIHIAQGAYTPDSNESNPNGTDDRQATFQLLNNLAIIGGYAGIGAKNPDARDILLYLTSLTGDLLENDNPGFANNNENSFHVVTASGTDNTAVIDGLTITAGNANDVGDNIYGAGLFNVNGHFAANNCTFSFNTAIGECGIDCETGFGGGIYNSQGSPILTNCAFIGNRAATYGGGIYNDNSNPSINSCTFTDNVGGNFFGGYGGGICNYLSDAEIIDCTFTNNGAGFGGGISNIESNPTITNCSITSSYYVGIPCNEPGACSSGMYNSQSNPEVNNCTFSINGGVGMMNWDSQPIVADCTFIAESHGMVNNQSDSIVINSFFTGNSQFGENGGGMKNIDSNLTITNCTFNVNLALSGGGIYSEGGSLVIENSIFTGNIAGYRGGGIATLNSSITITNCAFLENTAPLSQSQAGGAIFSEDSYLTLIDSVFNENQGYHGGAITAVAFDNADASLTITNCSISNNVAGVGGGVFHQDVPMIIINSTITGNQASGDLGSGGGIITIYPNGIAILANTTISANMAKSGGGVAIVLGGSMFANNSILWNNSPNQFSDSATVSFSNVQGGWPGIGNIDADPMFVDPGQGDFRLASGSPCIDAGHNWRVPVDTNDYDENGTICELFPVDLDGNPRFNADEADFDPGCGIPVVVDMGAYEYQFDPVEQVIFADLNGDRNVTMLDLLALFAEWGICETECCLADLDMNNTVNTTDLLILFANWGPCK